MQQQCLLETFVFRFASAKGPAFYAGGMSIHDRDDFGVEQIVEVETQEEDIECNMISDANKLEIFQEDKKVAEWNSSWGDFEGFGESMAKSETFDYTLEVLRSSSKSNYFENDTHCDDIDGPASYERCESDQPGEVDVRTVARSALEDQQKYANVFKSSFPEIPIQEPTEITKSFEQLLEAREEDNELVKVLTTQLGKDSWTTWRAAPEAESSLSLPYPCNESLKNLLLALGMDSSGKVDNGGLDSILKDPQPLSKADIFAVEGSKTLIQTKLLVPPDSKNGHGFTYQLYLKCAPLKGNLPAITLSGKKSMFTMYNQK
ncbi:uncharacterized protein CLBA1 [Ambystoma mexicanum]|uniref:uncharacterized protein CLBA1 n=1 Tax=Ambystoma mexicanum TaxID=8296 RepID=UPI0037E8F426